MGRKEDIMAEYEKLLSREGRIEFLMTRALLSREQIETIDQLGNPWPRSTPPGFEGMDQLLEALRRGEVSTEDAANHLASLDVYTQML